MPRRIHAVSAPRRESLGASGRASALGTTLTALQNNAPKLQGVISKPADAEPASAPQVSCKLSPSLAVTANVKMALHHLSLNTNCEYMCMLIFCKHGVHMQANHPGSCRPWCASKVSLPLLCAASADQFKTRRTSSHSCYEHAVRSFLCADRGALMNRKHNECRLQTLRHQVCADGKHYCKYGAFGCLELVGADVLRNLLPTMCSSMLCAALSQKSESIWLNVTCWENVLSACWFLPTQSRSTCF